MTSVTNWSLKLVCFNVLMRNIHFMAINHKIQYVVLIFPKGCLCIETTTSLKVAVFEETDLLVTLDLNLKVIFTGLVQLWI